MAYIKLRLVRATVHLGNVFEIDRLAIYDANHDLGDVMRIRKERSGRNRDISIGGDDLAGMRHDIACLQGVTQGVQ